MGSTNKTAHYELPQFVANDKPSWLGDVNEAMEAIDTGIYGAKSSADGAQQTANNAVAGVQSAGTRMDGIQTQLDTVATQANQTATTVAGHTSSIATNSANINTLNSRMGNTDISAIGDGTVTGAIASISGGGGAGAWSVAGTATGTTPVDISNITANEFLVLVQINDYTINMAIFIPKVALGESIKGLRTGYYQSNSINGSIRIDASESSIAIHTASAYYNGTDSTSTTTLTVYYR